MLIAGCLSRPQAWGAAVGALAFAAFGVFLLVRPEAITNDWPVWQKRLGAAWLVALGAVFLFLCVYNATTGHCLGTDLDAAAPFCPPTWQ